MNPTGQDHVPAPVGFESHIVSPDERTLHLLRGDLERQDARASKLLLVVPMVVLFGVGAVGILLSLGDDPERALRCLFLLAVASVLIPLALYFASTLPGRARTGARREFVDGPVAPMDPASVATTLVLLAVATPAMFVAFSFMGFAVIHLALGIAPNNDAALTKNITLASLLAAGIGVAVIDTMIVKRRRRRPVREGAPVSVQGSTRVVP